MLVDKKKKTCFENVFAVLQFYPAPLLIVTLMLMLLFFLSKSEAFINPEI